ncbi:MAG: hypothetical protein HKP61_11355 [Dactylosporangium sp.]|nr:hypothetical protein [Dactylosporangium sp.]
MSTSASSWFNSGLTYWSRQLNDKYFTAYARGTLYNQNFDPGYGYGRTISY